MGAGIRGKKVMCQSPKERLLMVFSVLSTFPIVKRELTYFTRAEIAVFDPKSNIMAVRPEYNKLRCLQFNNGHLNWI